MAHITSSVERFPDPVPEVPARAMSEAGLASLVLGALLVVTAPLVILVNIFLAHYMPSGLHMGPRDVAFATIGLVAGVILVMTLGVFGLVFGIRGLLVVRVGREPRTLAWAGVLTSGVGLFLWLMGAISLFSTLNSWAGGF